MDRMLSFYEALVKATLKDYPALSAFYTAHAKTIEIEAVQIEKRDDPRLPFLPQLTKSWTPGTVYEDHRHGTRDGALFLFDKDRTLLFGRTVAAACLGEFIRPMETAIRNGTFGTAGLAVHTVWHTDPYEPYSGPIAKIAEQKRGESVRIATFEMPDWTNRKRPETLLKHLIIDGTILRFFSQEFSEGFEKACQPVAERIMTKLELYPEFKGCILPREGHDIIGITPTPFHKDVKLYRMEDGTAVASLMERSGTVSLQSFTGSWKTILGLLHETAERLEDKNIRDSIVVL